ncbi:MAG TPA: protease modulator HflC [Gemmataceae bacterium]|nr:protease modulator HflC [Gemmataceae bacterium]
MLKYIVPIFLVIAVIVGVRLCCYTVDAAEYGYVTVLGQHRETFDGQTDAGLKIGLPWPLEQVQRLDRRMQQFDLPAMEQLTHDPEGNTIDKLLLIEAYVCWKIADKDGVDRFVKRIGSPDRARSILGPRINGQLGAAIGQKRMDDLVNTSSAGKAGKTKVDVTVEELRQNLLDTLTAQVRDEYGIELIDIRLRRFNHPVAVRESIYQRIRSERSKEAAKYKSEGERLAKNIESEADQDVREKLANARAAEEKIKAEADIAAQKIRNDAYSQDVKFYAFLKEMDELQSILGNSKTILLLSTHRPMFERIFQPPAMKSDAAKDKEKKK